MKTLSATLISTCAVIALASGCAVGEATQEDIAEADQALCENRDGVNAVMTGLAVASGREMRRWLAMRDFRWNTSTDRLELTEWGNLRCPNGQCINTTALLALQNAPDGTVKFPGGITLKASSLRSTLKSNWNEAIACFNNGSCPQEDYDMQYTNWEKGSCDVKYFFNVYKKDTSTRITDAASLTKLNDNLIFLGYPENKMLNFYVRNGQPSIDPTGGLNEGGTTTSGSCTVACSKFSASNIAGSCCSCNGVTKSYVQSTFSSYMFLCQ